MRILIIEDDTHLARVLQLHLQEEGFIADCVTHGSEGLARAAEVEFAVIILDLTVRDMDGCDLCEQLRRSGNNTPVLMLTGRRSTRDKVRALDSGADDYLAKPFELAELQARLRSLLRRSVPERSPQLVVGDLVLDPATHAVALGGQKIDVSSKPYCLLEFLMRNRGRVVTRDELLDQVWGITFDLDSNLVDVHISHLRSKIDKSHRQSLIRTERGMGYRLDDASGS